MNTKTLGWLPTRQRLFLACLLLVGLSSLFACASRTTGSGAAGGEIVTASDEPEARRRARLRLELAVAYFEEGKTTVALDELKQSIAADPAYSEAYNLRGLIYMRLNDYRFAEESFMKALSLRANDANVMHNLAWLLCQQARYAQAQQLFSQALADPNYAQQGKTWRSQGLCQMRAGQSEQAKHSLLKSYEFDPGNPVTAYNLASLLFQGGDFVRAQFYVRRLNNTELANAESLWLGVKVERRMENREAMLQLAAQLLKRFPQSREAGSYQRGAFDD